MVFGDSAFEEVLLFLDVHHLGEPWEWVGGSAFDEWLEAAGCEATVGDEVDVLLELNEVETDGCYWETVADECFFEADAFGHSGAEVFAELGSPDLWVLVDEIHEEIAEKLDVVGFVT